MPEHTTTATLFGNKVMMAFCVAVFCGAGCAGALGDAPQGEDSDTGSSNSGVAPTYDDQTSSSDASDASGDAGAGDSDAGDADTDDADAGDAGSSDADAVVPDANPPDTTGQTCADNFQRSTCGAKGICFYGRCRPLCGRPADGCFAHGNCPSDHGCVKVTGSALVQWGVCQPGRAAGETCTSENFCATGHACINGRCTPTCAAGQTCARSVSYTYPGEAPRTCYFN